MRADKLDDPLGLKDMIREIPGFPKPGVSFKDITPMLKDPESFRKVIDFLADKYRDKGIDSVVAAEARGFIFGASLAHQLGAGFVPLRKAGKLPHGTIRQEFMREYGRAEFEVHEDAVKPGERVLIFDDLLATGGTAEAAAKLIERLGGKIIGFEFLIELRGLKGRDKIRGYEIGSLIKYKR